MMRTPYVKHVFGDAVDRELRSRMGWLTAGVASSIPWPASDVWVNYDGHDYFLRGTERGGQASPPGITVACAHTNPQIDAALERLYRFTSILGWYRRGYVDVSGYTWGTAPVLYGDPRKVFTTLHDGQKFNCNHMPIVEDENVRKALAFWREGQRLRGVHDSYAFLSFYKVIESQFDSAGKVAWIDANIDALSDQAAARVAELRADAVDVNRHLFESGRCAVAHASIGRDIVDPDIPSDRRRLSSDLVVIEALAERLISTHLGVPDEMTCDRERDRLAPWASLLSDSVIAELRAGNEPDVSALNGLRISVGLWPTGIIPGFEDLELRVVAVHQGVVSIRLSSAAETFALSFLLDFRNGKVHTQLDHSGLINGADWTEQDARAYFTLLYFVIGNQVAELVHGDLEPVDCEVVIPVNVMLTKAPAQCVDDSVAHVLRVRDAAR